ncbi:Multisubunit Na+/H+ antiporter MnhE subunit [Beutenbergia cavernae DSM 12333]|uniref:Multisubunit Na+/H+ antiporter MnhE subunit n=1 Tax=Beutenbergia cavernae (strain ATCC BAA-8 / DSM 12333 / CCUG 43141 / JCM 11478 / NBRC 16432 / NCIMB 13614 / HKI 0122) TaxID=471853 RepID=C5C4D3_BEUC1|nr:Na+/H+ antiporter subunit E [Beutenbergia cavernae]ACQ82057.1 Multisubunit Na+/H+ antiporter MnhE subunit [Beutenbergia cavernae DSM 12333]
MGRTPSPYPRPPARDRRLLRTRWAHILWLTLVWILLWGDLTLANVLAGALIAVIVTRVLPLPAVEFSGRVYLPGLLVLLGRFTVDVVVASAQVASVALRRHEPRGAVIRVPLLSRSDLYLTLTAELCSLVPGSIIVEAHRVTGTLYVHVLDAAAAGGLEAARATVLGQERRVLYALASDEEIERAGLPPRRFVRRSRRSTEVTAP